MCTFFWRDMDEITWHIVGPNPPITPNAIRPMNNTRCVLADAVAIHDTIHGINGVAKAILLP